MKLFNALLAVAALSAGVAMANEHKGDKTPNCDVKGKMTHVKDEAACAKKKGTWKVEAAAVAAPAEAAPAAAPVEAAPHK